MCKEINDSIPILNKKIVFMIENKDYNFSCICALLDMDDKLIDMSDLLCSNSENRNFGIFLKRLTGMQWDHYALMMVKKCSFGKKNSLIWNFSI